MKILCVAEKPSAAKEILKGLSQGNHTSNRPGKDKYCRNYDLEYNWQNYGFVQMTITSVRGHLNEIDFPERYRKWHTCDPVSLFDAPVETKLSKVSRQGSLVELVLVAA